MIKSQNTLTRKEHRQVEDWLLAHKEEIEAGRWTQPKVADTMATKLGRPVTAANIGGAARAVEVNFKTGGSRDQGKGLRNYHEMRAAVGFLANEIASLKGELGQVVSPTLSAMAEINGHVDD